MIPTTKTMPPEEPPVAGRAPLHLSGAFGDGGAAHLRDPGSQPSALAPVRQRTAGDLDLRFSLATKVEPFRGWVCAFDRGFRHRLPHLPRMGSPHLRVGL